MTYTAPDSEALAQGYSLPTGTSLIRYGDDAIKNNAKTAAGAFNAAINTVDRLAVTAESLPAGSTPTASVTGTIPYKTIHLGIPKGDPGADGTDGTDGADGADGMGYAEGQQLIAQNQTTLDAAEAAAAAATTAAGDAADAAVSGVMAQIGAEVTAELEDTSSPAYAALVAQAGTLTDPQVEALVSSTTSATAAALSNRDGLLSVTAYGAAGDGVTDDRAAIMAADAAAAAAGLTVYAPPGTYLVSGALALTAPLTGAGADLTVIQLGTATTRLINMLGPATVSRVTLDADGLASTEVVRLSEGGGLYACTVTDTGYVAPYGVTTAGRDDNVTVQGCTLTALVNAVRITDGSSHVALRDNRITHWRQRGIWVASGDCDDVVIEGNHVTDLAAGGSSRYPIRVEGTTSSHTNFVVRGNYVEGPHTSYHDTTTPGTGDQIALTHITGLLVEGNTSVGGGDVGITVSVDCKNVRIIGNRVEDVDTCGIFAGAGAAAAPGSTVDNYTILGNTIINAGRSRAGDRQDQYRVGVRMSDSRNMVVEGNVITNTDAASSTQYMVSVKDSANLTIGANQPTALAKGTVLDEGGNINVGRVETDTAPTSITLTPAPDYDSVEVTARRKNGMVTLSLRFATGTATSPTVLATLPQGYRPPHAIRGSVATSGNLTAHINITTSGTITPVWQGTPGGSPFQGTITFIL